MIRLLHAELTRFRSRKIVWIAFGLMTLAVAGLTVAFALQAQPPSAAALAEGRSYYQQNHDQWETNHVAAEKDCQDSEPAGTDCTQAWPEPQLSDYLPTQMSFTEVAGPAAMVGAALLALTSAVVAASLIGADFATGAMSNWLSFIPVRWRVYVSKLGVAVVGATVIAAVVLLASLLALAVAVPGSFGRLTGWPQVWQVFGRAVAVITLAGTVGATIAFLTRRTIAAVGIIGGYLVVSLISQVFSQTSWYEYVIPWLPESNVLAVLMADYGYTVFRTSVTADGISGEPVEMVLHWERGLVYVLVGTAALVVASLVTFRRRDLT